MHDTARDRAVPVHAHLVREPAGVDVPVRAQQRRVLHARVQLARQPRAAAAAAASQAEAARVRTCRRPARGRLLAWVPGGGMSGRRRACGVGAHTERGRHRHRHGEPGQQRRRGHSQPPRGTRRVGRDRPASQWRALGLVNWRPLGGGPGPGRRVGRRAPRVPPAAQPAPAPAPPPSSGSSAASTTSAASAPSADRRWRWQAMRRGGGAGAAGARRGAALRRCAPEASQPANVLLPARRGCGCPAGVQPRTLHRTAACKASCGVHVHCHTHTEHHPTPTRHPQGGPREGVARGPDRARAQASKRERPVAHDR